MTAFTFPPFYRFFIIIVIALILSYTFYYSLDRVLPIILPVSCILPAPVGGTIINNDCSRIDRLDNFVLSSSEPLHSQRQLSASLLNSSSSMNETLASSSSNNNVSLQDQFQNYLVDDWSFTGYYKESFVSAKVNLYPDGFYTSQGTIQFDENHHIYEVNGTYSLASDRMILYFVSDDGIQSLYAFENIKENSFHAFNPNSFESYSFVRVS